MSNMSTNPDADSTLVYTQDDVDGILAKLRNAQQEAELSNQLLWAVVEGAGGSVSVSILPWLNGMPEGRLEFEDRPEIGIMRLRIVRDEDE